MTFSQATAKPPAPAGTAIRVFVAEDHHITLWGLRQLIAGSQTMELVGTARSRAELMDHQATSAADVIVLDLDLGGEDAGASLALLRDRSTAQVLVLTASDDVEQHRAVMLKGARGVVHKSEPAETILRAIEKVNQGEIWLNSLMLGQVLELLTSGERQIPRREVDPDAARIASLTQRERDIVIAMVRSSGAKQLAVADSLGISEHTLRNHLTTIYSKLGVHGRLELHVYATAHGVGVASNDNLAA
jgi:DNA-binding NarL/FixJ family response regulator